MAQQQYQIALNKIVDLEQNAAANADQKRAVLVDVTNGLVAFNGAIDPPLKAKAALLQAGLQAMANVAAMPGMDRVYTDNLADMKGDLQRLVGQGGRRRKTRKRRNTRRR